MVNSQNKMFWEPLRTRERYKKLHEAVNDAITLLYEREFSPNSCGDLCYATWKLMRYIHAEISRSL